MTEYRRYQGKSYMVWTKDTAVEGYEYPMLTENRILGLLPLKITNADTKMQFWYDISGKQVLEDWTKIRKPGCEFLKKFMAALIKTMEQTGEYLLGEDGISLMPDRIFVDTEEKEIAFCYMPFEKVNFADALRSFMEYYISHMEHGCREEIQKCYMVYEKCQEANVKMEELLQILFEKDTPLHTLEQEEETEDIVENSIQEIPVKTQEKKCLSFLESTWNKKILPLKKPKFKEETYVFEPEEYQTEASNPTVFLGSENNQIIGELKFEGEEYGNNLKITAPVFLIGSQREEVEGFIADETISRIHAKILKENEQYYLEDMNSTNGTYHNGTLLNYRERVLLEKNDKVSFANVGYRFV